MLNDPQEVGSERQTGVEFMGAPKFKANSFGVVIKG